MAIVVSGTTGIDAGSLPVANTGKISAGSGLPVILNTAGVDRVTVDTNGNVGIGVVPSGWSSTGNIELMDSKVISIRGNINISSNGYYNSGWKAINTGEVTLWYTYNGGWSWQSAPSTAAGQTPMFSQKMQLDNNGNLLLTSGTGGLGYGTGAGGTVIQLTSKSTTVTLNKPCGTIITSNSTLAPGSIVSFIVYNNLVTAADLIYVYAGAYSSSYQILVDNTTEEDGKFNIRITNTAGITLSNSIPINFSIIKGARA